MVMVILNRVSSQESPPLWGMVRLERMGAVHVRRRSPTKLTSGFPAFRTRADIPSLTKAQTEKKENCRRLPLTPPGRTWKRLTLSWGSPGSGWCPVKWESSLPGCSGCHCWCCSSWEPGGWWPSLQRQPASAMTPLDWPPATFQI